MIKLNIKTDFRDVERMLKQLPKEIEQVAMARTLNRVVDSARTKMRQEIGQEFNLPAREIRERLFVRPARRGGQGAMTAELYSTGRSGGRSINLIRFVERKVSLAEGRRRAKAGTAKDVYVKVLRKGGPKRVADAFIANKGRTMFRRVGKARLPIEPVQVVDVPAMFTTRRINEKVIAHIRKVMPEIAAREIASALRRAGGR